MQFQCIIFKERCMERRKGLSRWTGTSLWRELLVQVKTWHLYSKAKGRYWHAVSRRVSWWAASLQASSEGTSWGREGFGRQLSWMTLGWRQQREREIGISRDAQELKQTRAWRTGPHQWNRRRCRGWFLVQRLFLRLSILRHLDSYTILMAALFQIDTFVEAWGYGQKLWRVTKVKPTVRQVSPTTCLKWMQVRWREQHA